MAKNSGKNTRCIIGSNTFGVKSWKVKETCPGADTTDTEAGGNNTYQDVLTHLEWSMECEYDPATNPMTNAPTLTTGVGPEVKIYLLKNSPSQFWDMPITYIDDVDYDAPVDGIVKFTITGKSNGPFTRPS